MLKVALILVIKVFKKVEKSSKKNYKILIVKCETQINADIPNRQFAPLLILDCCRDELKTFYIGVYKFFPQSVPKD
jgi:hypothetical protein